MKYLFYLITVLTLIGCKDDDQFDVEPENPFIFYQTEGAKWFYSDTVSREFWRAYPNPDKRNILSYSCYGTFTCNEIFTLGNEVILYSKVVANELDTAEVGEFKYLEVLAESKFIFDSSFAVTPMVGDKFWDLTGTKTLEKGTSSNPVLSGWIRFDSENKKVFSRQKVGRDYFDTEVFDFGCEDGCEEIEVEGKTFIKTPQIIKYAVSGISLTHFSSLDLPEEFILSRANGWSEGCNFSLVLDKKTYIGPTFPF